jgi:GMP synthase-like glutamine amidotransferase
MGVHEVVDFSSADVRVAGIAGQVRRRRRVARRTMAGRVLVLQDRELGPGGWLLESLRARALEPEVLRIDRDGPLPEPELLDLAIVVGTARVSGGVAPAWLEREIDWLRRADRAGTAVLALGSAAQALAIALGGTVKPVPRARRIWTRVTTTAPERIGAGPWLAWEDDLIVLPPGAELLAHDHVGPQAFGVNEHLGVQFHPEVTPEIVLNWLITSDEVLDFQGIMEATWRDFPIASAPARRLFAEFVDSVIQDRS